MRILIVSDAWKPQVNGVVRTYEDLSRHLMADSHEVRVIGPADFKLRRPMPGYPEIELVLMPGRALKKMVDDFAPETVHIATEGPLGWAMRRLCLKRGWPFTTAYHTHFPDYAALRAAEIHSKLHRPVRETAIHLVRRFHAPAGAILISTASVEQTLRGWGFTAPILRLTRGVETEIFHPGPKTLFADLPRPVALYVGRVAIEKNIGAFLEMPWEGSKVVVGSGPGLETLKAACPKTVFTGVKRGAELADHFRSADIFVFPSRTDTFGIVLIEAIACGLPVAAYPVTGPADIITEPILGALDINLERAAQDALKAPGTAEDRFSWLEKNYTWAIATRQFLEAQNGAIIPNK